MTTETSGSSARPQREAERLVLRTIVGRLKRGLKLVSSEEIERQAAGFDDDSRRGRELLYLTSNENWIRATREEVELSASDSIETTLHVHVDLTQIGHEAIRDRVDKGDALWLPLAVIPPEGPTPPLLAPSPTVVDATGTAVPSLLQSEVRRAMAAALADIILEMGSLAIAAPNHRPGEVGYEYRLVLSAELYRVLRDTSICSSATTSTDKASENTAQKDGTREPPNSRHREINDAKKGLEEAVESLYSQFVDLTAPAHNDGSTLDQHERKFVLACRAARIISALSTPTTLVVVTVPVGHLPTVFSVRLPSATLKAERNRSDRIAKLYQKFEDQRCITTLLKYWPSLPNSRASLMIGLLIPSGEANRNFSFQLPDGVSFQDPETSIEAAIEVFEPPSWRRFNHLVERVETSESPRLKNSSREVIEKLQAQQIDAIKETYRYHREISSDAQSATSVEDAQGEENPRLKRLLVAEDAYKGSSSNNTGLNPSRRATNSADETDTLYRILQRRIVTPSLAHVRALSVGNPAVRTTPKSASVTLWITANSQARESAVFAGASSSAILLIAAVLQVIRSDRFDPQVLAGVLTLFAVILAGQTQRPDRATLRGKLQSVGWWAVVVSIAPPILLAIVLSFSTGMTSSNLTGAVKQSMWIEYFTRAALVVQLLLLLATVLGARIGHRPRWELSSRTGLDYERVDALRTVWWQSTTAGALLLGRPAYGYLVQQTLEGEGDLVDLLDRAVSAPGAGSDGDSATGTARREPKTTANMLALLRAGTNKRSLTFLVFRQELEDPNGSMVSDWLRLESDRPIVVSLDTERLVAREAMIGSLDFYLGVSNGSHIPVGEHPVRSVLDEAKKHGRAVLDVQLPSTPPPRSAYSCTGELLWTRVRIGVGSRELEQLGTFLNAVSNCVYAPGGYAKELIVSVASAGTSSEQSWHHLSKDDISAADVSTNDIPAADVSTNDIPAADDGQIGSHAESDIRAELSPYLTPSDLDLVAKLNDVEAAGTWYVGAVCAYPRSGVELDVLDKLKGLNSCLRLAGFMTASMHGSTVMLFLLQDKNLDPTILSSEHVRNEWRSLQLKLAEQDAEFFLVYADSVDGLRRTEESESSAFLQMYVECSDQPGIYADLLEKLGSQLGRASNGMAQIESPVWYARLEVADGRTAASRAMFCLSENPTNRNEEREYLNRIERALRRSLLDPALTAGGRGEARTLVRLTMP